jgi:excisionase family DNA binding protein
MEDMAIDLTELTVPPASAGRLLDIDGLAARLGVTERFVRRLVEERRVPYFKLGRLVRFDAAEIEDWLVSHHIDPPVDARPVHRGR